MARRRIHGPYRHGQRWRLVLIGEDGTTVVESFGTENEAAQEKFRLEQQLEKHQGVTVNQALDKYELYQRGKGNKPRSIETTRGRINKLLGDLGACPVRLLSEFVCAEAYAKLQSDTAVDTHRNALNETKTFFNWCAARPRRWMGINPLAEVKGIGKRKKGKPQLTQDESIRFMDKALELAQAGNMDGIVASTLLLFGTRATETLTRQVRHLDDGGKLIRITESKTDAGVRVLGVPEVWQPILLSLAKGKQPTDLLFGELDRHMAFRMVERVCKAAGVPRITPHGLRGTWASLAEETSIASQLVAAHLGHGSFNVTRQHYLAPGVEDKANQRRVLGVLQGGKK